MMCVCVCEQVYMNRHGLKLLDEEASHFQSCIEEVGHSPVSQRVTVG